MPAAVLPVARVLAETGLPHLDRPFDYLVPDQWDAAAVPGVRVRVRFSGRLVNGFLLERVAESAHDGRLTFLDRVVSAEPVLSPQIAELCRSVADRYGGTMEDVLRLAVPPRHARAESRPAPVIPGLAGTEPSVTQPAVPPPGVSELGGPPPSVPQPAVEKPRVSPPDGSGWARYQAGTAFLHAVGLGKPARAVWQAAPGESWADRLAEAIQAAVAVDRGALAVVPDVRELTLLDAAVLRAIGPGHHVVLTADLGPAERYRRFLAVRRGQVRVVIGTRSAAFAPIHSPGLLALFDDGDDLLSELRSPYPHAREVLTLRSATEQVAMVIAGFARTAEAQLLVESRWASAVVADRSTLRACAPRIEAIGDRSVGADSGAAGARLSPAAFAAARAALAADAPVLVQVPRRGYQPGLACTSCRRAAHCQACAGPLQLNRAESVASCRWCGRLATGWRCPVCASAAFRATVVGSNRTSEELGRAFPGVRVVTSDGDTIVTSVPAEPALVVATPGAEPIAAGGYGAALLLDGGALLARSDLRAAEETLRRWMAAVALVRPAGAGGRVVIGADSSLATVQAVIRWDAPAAAAAELAGRRELGFPPAVAMAAVEGSPAAVASFLDDLRLPVGAEVLGPVAVAGPPPRRLGGGPASGASPSGEPVTTERAVPTERALIRIELGRGRELAAAIHASRAARSARKDPDPARVRLDPLTVL